MATTKKGSAGSKAGTTGAGKGTGKANGMAKQSKTSPAAKGAAATRRPAPVKLNDRQREFLGKIHGAGEAGYEVGAKVEQRTIDALVDRKLVKKGAKDKASGKVRYLVTKAGHKHLSTPTASASTPTPSPATATESAPATEPAAPAAP